MRDSAKIKKSLKYSIIDGAFYSSMVGFGESFFGAFAVFMKASIFQLGLLGALPQALGSFSGVFSDRLLRLFRSRRKMVLIGATLQGLMYILILLSFYAGISGVTILIASVCAYWIFSLIVSPAWNSWMGDLTKDNSRGRYFGNRNKVAGMSSFIAFILGGLMLQRFTEGSLQYIGFVVIFLLAFVSRMLSVIYLSKKYEPEYKISPTRYRFREFFRELRKTNFGILVLYLCLMNFAVFLSAPFFTAYMLYDLQLSYANFTIVTAAAIILKYIAMPIWGKAADRFGAKKVLTLAGYMMPIVPVLWIFSHNLVYLFIIQMYAGFIWAAFEIASLNFIFDTTTAERRAAMVAYYNVLNGFGIIIGAVLGSFIATHNTLFWSRYFLVFLLSFILRLIASVVFVPRLQEVRHVQKIGYQKLFMKVVATMPTMGLIYDIIPLRRRDKVRRLR
jgi:MFS family permease